MQLLLLAKGFVAGRRACLYGGNSCSLAPSSTAYLTPSPPLQQAMDAAIVALSALSIMLQLVDVGFGIFTCSKVGAAARYRLH
jgi:hypothetical protein